MDRVGTTGELADVRRVCDDDLVVTPAEEVPSILTERLELVSMSLAFMRALRDGDLAAASGEIGARVPAGLRVQLEHFLEYRIPMLAADPASRPWLGRAMVMTDEDGRRAVVGTIGFHAPPDETGRVEIGYSVEPGYRRRGLATEAVAAMLAWAEANGVHRFRASVSPTNEPSLAIVRSFGFRRTGVQWDEFDGEELVFELDRS